VTIPVQITFRHMESSAAVETRVRELTNHLGTFSDRIQGCRVVVDRRTATSTRARCSM